MFKSFRSKFVGHELFLICGWSATVLFVVIVDILTAGY